MQMAITATVIKPAIKTLDFYLYDSWVPPLFFFLIVNNSVNFFKMNLLTVLYNVMPHIRPMKNISLVRRHLFLL